MVMFEVKFGGKRHPAASLAEASKLFTTWIEANDLGASDLKLADGWLYKIGSPRTHFGYVSYNGRTWKGTYGHEDHEEIFDNVIDTIVPQDEAPTSATKLTIADVIRKGISDGLDNGAVLVEVKKAFPQSNTSAACVSYYRSKMKKTSSVAPTKVAAARKVELKKVDYLVKEWKQGFTANVYLDGKAYCTVIDMGDEISPHFEFSNLEAYKVLNIEELRSMASDILAQKEYDKLTKGKVALIKDGKLYTVKGASEELVRKKNPTATVVNGMPLAQFKKVMEDLAQ